MAYVNALANALSDTFTDERYPLGSTYVQTEDEVDRGGSGVSTTTTFSLLQGERTWIFVQAKTAVAAGQLCRRDAIATQYVVDPDDQSEPLVTTLVGVADHAIDANSYGWIIAKGTCVALVSAGVAAADLLASDGDNTVGGLDTIANGAGAALKVVGEALEAKDATLTNYAQARIDLMRLN
tara:strand:- start:864 stop:1406 length:543 start_codon:yes stop_codon:yes gene_type:complete